MDENGDISDVPHTEKSTAERHTAAGKFSSYTPSHVEDETDERPIASQDAAVDEVTDMFAGLNKKKKKSSKPKTEDAEEVAPPAAADTEFDLSALKKKKKKSSKPKATDGGDFDAKLAEVGLDDKAGEEDAGADNGEQAGDLEAGTGIWQHNATTAIQYPLLLSRFFTLLNQFNPDILSSGSKSYKIPPPQCLREGNKKTIFANIAEICKRMKRNDEHVTQFLFAELGTSGSVDGSKRLVIKGRFQQKQIENVLRRYIGMPLLIAPVLFQSLTTQ